MFQAEKLGKDCKNCGNPHKIAKAFNFQKFYCPVCLNAKLK